jgi:hypothetical protein
MLFFGSEPKGHLNYYHQLSTVCHIYLFKYIMFVWITVREHQWSNQEWTIQIHMQHCALNKAKTNETKITTQKAKKISKMYTTKRLVVNPYVHRVQAVPVYYKALLVLVKIKSDKKNSVGDRRKKQST